MTTDLTTYDDPIENTIKAFDKFGFKYGSVIPEKFFIEHFRIGPVRTIDDHIRNTMIYARYMGLLRDRLLQEKDMALRTKSGVGQEVVQPAEQTKWAMKTFQDEIFKTYEKARERVSHIAFEMLSDVERKENSDAVAKLSFFANRTVKRLSW